MSDLIKWQFLATDYPHLKTYPRQFLTCDCLVFFRGSFYHFLQSDLPLRNSIKR